MVLSESEREIVRDALKGMKEEVKIMNEVFDDNHTIQNGPFKGMKYIKRSSGSALLPKILGSYEEPIQKWVEEVVEKKKYQNIIDIGCAEGYYACGFAKRLPNSKITAYDIDKEARKNTAELMKVNNLTNIEIKAECTHSELNEKSIFNTLVFCDLSKNNIKEVFVPCLCMSMDAFAE